MPTPSPSPQAPAEDSAVDSTVAAVDAAVATAAEEFSAADMQAVRAWFTAECRPGAPAEATADALQAGAEAVAILRPLGLDAHGLRVALLQQLMPVTDAEMARIAARFGDDTADLLRRAWRMRQLSALLQDGDGRARQSRFNEENLRKMLIAFVDDIRVVLLELARHLVALRRARTAGVDQQTALGRLSMEVFAPLANRLGIWQFKWRMEDLALRFLHPAEYRELAAKLAETRAQRERYIGEIAAAVRAELATAGIDGAVYGRPKHLHGIWKKMRAKGLAFGDVQDIRALRIIVESVADCYAALAAVHTRWRHMPAEFSDYIATPKSNGYRSIHTVIRGPGALAVEVQIRTAAMHAASELGLAAHWRYKEGAQSDENIDNKIIRLRQLLQWKDELRSGTAGDGGDGDGNGNGNGDGSHSVTPADFPHSVTPADSPHSVTPAVFKAGAADGDGNGNGNGNGDGGGDGGDGDGDSSTADGRVYVFTPKGMVVDLPAGATPIDFAYAIHTQVGHRIRGARVDGNMSPLNRPLQTGQQVRIQTARNGRPSRDWLRKDLGYARTRRARGRIALWFKRADYDSHLADGRAMLERELTRLGIEDLRYDKIARAAHFNKVDDLLAAIGAGDFKLSRALAPFRPARAAGPPGKESRESARDETASKPRAGEFSVSGVGNVVTRMANCCRPIPGDSIVGFITSGRGVSIHRRDCHNVCGLDEARRARLVEVKWGQAGAAAWPVELHIAALHRADLLPDITRLLQDEKVTVLKLRAHTDGDDDNATIRARIEITGLRQLNRIARRLQTVTGVQKVGRG